MLRSLIVFLSICITASLAIQCYMGRSFVPSLPNTPGPVLVNCVNENYCFKTWVSTNTDGNSERVNVTRGCGSSLVCRRNACTGPAENRRCCCTGDICNGAEGATVMKSLMLTSAAVMAWRLL